MTAAAVLADGQYRPTEDEEFMNERQLEYFRQKLLNWKEDILRESRETVTHLQSETENHPDLADRASSETDRALELRTRDRQRKLISKIDEALRRIATGTYGQCSDCGIDIPTARLHASPTALRCTACQDRHERHHGEARPTL